MKIIRNLNEPNPLKEPIALTIGNFDGVHLGHQHLLGQLKQNTQAVVVSFENHPQSLLSKNYQHHFICTPAHKLKLLEGAGVDLLLLLQFNEDIRQKNADEFLSEIHTKLPFTHLILGYDAVLGNNRQGTKDQLIEVANKLNFKIEYLEPVIVDQKPVSSSLIRKAIKQGQLDIIKTLLGREYSIYGTVVKGMNQGKALGFPTANIDVSELTLPPLGVYAVEVEFGSKKLKGIVNLGVAPTMRESNIPILEIHLLDHSEDLYGKELNVIFKKFIRPEMHFPSVDALKIQIKNDIDQAKHFLTR